ncbi:hypothetical protein HYY74_02245 [Candidatus Woesearchaeota archaeon]|nr:hypothetical protein [Candidatus Woesearchaeota archaeon]
MTRKSLEEKLADADFLSRWLNGVTEELPLPAPSVELVRVVGGQSTKLFRGGPLLVAARPGNLYTFRRTKPTSPDINTFEYSARTKGRWEPYAHRTAYAQIKEAGAEAYLRIKKVTTRQTEHNV